MYEYTIYIGVVRTIVFSTEKNEKRGPQTYDDDDGDEKQNQEIFLEMTGSLDASVR